MAMKTPKPVIAGRRYRYRASRQTHLVVATATHPENNNPIVVYQEGAGLKWLPLAEFRVRFADVR